MENSKEYERIKHQLKLNSDDSGKIQYARFVRFTFREITHFLNMNFNLNDIAITLIRDTGLNVRYHSLWVAYNRALKKNKSKVIEIEKDNLTEKREAEETGKVYLGTKEEKPKESGEKVIAEEEPDELEKEVDDYSWLKDPKLGFDHLNHPIIIGILKDYQLTIDDLREIKVDGIKHILKCHDLIVQLGEKRKTERINKKYFGTK